MPRLLHQYLTFLFLLFSYSAVIQAQYDLLSNNGETVIDCEGDVEDGGIGGNNPGDYGLNENQTFTVCIPNAVQITISVNSFSTEATHDSLTIYAGNDLSGTMLMTLNGDQSPTSITIPGQAAGGISCFTFHFYSDLAVTRPGFNISWDATLQQPPPIPPFTINDVPCLEESFLINLPAPILCSAVTAGSFTISGSNAPAVSNAIPQNCINGQTTSILIELANPITSGGVYGLFFFYSYTDICDDVWNFNAVANFTVTNCPLEVLLPEEYINCGSCSFLSPIVTGGNGVYNYTWSPPLLEGANVAQGNACPPVSSTYFLTVTDGLGQSVTVSTYIEVCPFTAFLPDASFCEGNCLNLSTITTGGYPPYSYQWQASDPTAVTNIFSNAATNSVCAVSNTTLNVTITDATGNTATASANLTVCPFTATVSTSSLYCGAPLPINANPSGGSGQYNYLWNPALIEGANVQGGTVQITAPTLYSVTVTDAVTGQTIEITGILIDLCPLTASIAGPDLVCNETADIIAIVTGPSNDYSYQWSPALNEGANVASGTITITQPTNYSLTVTDNFTGVQVFASWFVDVCPLQAFVAVAVYACDSLTDVNFCIPVTAIAQGGDGNYTVQWQAPFDTLQGFGPHFICITDTIMPIAAIISDGTGTSITATGWLQNCPFVVVLDTPNSVCEDTGYCADIEATAYGGTFEYEYNWAPPYDYLVGEGPHTICFSANTPSPVVISLQIQSGNQIYLVEREIAICPFYVSLSIDSLFCPGQSDTLNLDIGGGVSPYTLNWSVNGGGNPFGIDTQLPYDPYIVTAPATATSYTIEYVAILTDATGATRYDTAVVVFNPAPLLPDTIVEVCQSEGLTMPLLPDSGFWEGDNLSGNLFSVSDAGTFELTYFENECSTTTTAIVHPTPVFTDIYATCEGGAPFMVDPPPMSGQWSDTGGFITPAGLFTPGAGGVYSLTFTTDNGCAGQTSVNVQAINLNVSATVVCATDIELFASPSGGWWTGSSAIFTNAGNTFFSPTDAGAGNYTLQYNLPGNCAEQINVSVVDVDVQDYLQVCPFAAPIISLPGIGLPPGGIWSSNSLPSGLTNPVTGTFNPTIQGGNDFSEVLTYTFDGCSDQLTLDVNNTVISNNSLSICHNADSINISNLASPPGGFWSGSGIAGSGTPAYFNPSSVLPGTYQLSYSVNGCSSLMNMTVHPIDAGGDLIRCVTDAFFVIPNFSPPNPPGGLWTGTGILPGAETIGIFDPLLANPVNNIIYQSPSGCTDTLIVFVNSVEPVTIQTFGTFVCYNNIDLPLNATPFGGTFTGIGITGNATDGYTFNPVDAGPGPVLLTYQYDNGCSNLAFYAFNVGDSITISTPPDTLICKGYSLPVSAFASGGAHQSYTYNWDNSLGFGQIHAVSPNQTTLYTVTVTDGCTIPATADIMVSVADSISYTYTTNQPVCYGQEGFIDLNLPDDSEYVVNWQHTSQNTTYISGTAGTYYAVITNSETGCHTDAVIDMPNYPLVYAGFETNENQAGCVKSLQLFFTDFSLGGTSGYWDFGDGSTAEYFYGEIVQHYYELPGTYTVTLYLENEGNCNAVISRNICIELSNDFVLPNAFSPNQDGRNDVFRPVTIGMETFEMQIFNRWGEQVYSTQSQSEGWNGTFNNKDCELGVYVWHLKYKMLNSPKEYYLKGNVTLIR